MFTRKYRQKHIEDMIGSSNVRVSLTKLLESGKFSNTIILSGDNGIGKTSMAYSIAYKLMCGCGEQTCSICPPIEQQLWENKKNVLTDVYEFDLGKDRDERFVDRVIDVFKIAGKKVIILDEIQNLSQMNMTKFLKTFETIEEDTYLIICTTELYKLNSGIISRCNVYELTPPSTMELASYLETICRMESVNFSREAIYAIANIKYKVRDALLTLETVINLYGSVNTEEVREFFGKDEGEYAIQFLELCKNSSPYGILELLKKVKEDIGIHKFTVSLKEMIVDCVYSRYNVIPVLQTEQQMQVLGTVINRYSTEELMHTLREVEKFQGRSNIDKEIILINLAFALSNGSILKKVGAEEESIEKRKQEKPELKEGVLLGVQSKDSEKSSFTFETPSVLGNEKKENKEVIIDNEEGLWDTLEDIFGERSYL